MIGNWKSNTLLWLLYTFRKCKSTQREHGSFLNATPTFNCIESIEDFSSSLPVKLITAGPV